MSGGVLRCVDVAAARRFVEAGDQAPLSDVLTQAAAELGALAGDDRDPALRLAILEELRPGLWRLLTRFEREQLGRALPFSEAEDRRWRLYIECWSLMLAAYMASLADLDRGCEALDYAGVLLPQRIVRQAVQVAIASFRAYQPVAPALWQLIHEHLGRAERLGTLDLPVADPTIPMDARGTIGEAILHLLMLDFCDPYSYNPAQLSLASLWLERLARHARFSLEPVPHGAAGYLLVHLAHSHGLRLLPEVPGAAEVQRDITRYVDLGRARDQVKRLLAKLRLGIAPQDLYLEGDCTLEEADVLLQRILRTWRTHRRRVYPRRAANEPIQVALGLHAVHRLSGELAAAGAAHALPPAALMQSRIVDQSPSGLGLLQAAGSGARLRCQQLVALIAAREVLLGSVRWLTMDPAAGLRYGVRLIPGRPRAVLLNDGEPADGSVADGAVAADQERALLLPAMPGLGDPASLVLPTGLFWVGRQFLLRPVDPADPQVNTRLVRLERQLEIGSDFERIGFTDVP